MTTLRVIIDQILSPIPGGVGRYAEELTRQLIETAPQGSLVEGVVSASPEEDYARLEHLLPGLVRVHKMPLARRELSLAWQYGVMGLPGRGMVHAMSVLAPLHRHDRLHSPGDQTAVTIHDVVPWTNPETLTPRGVSWHKAMVHRAHRYADAIVVPTHTVAEQLSEIFDFGDRVRVIGGAASTRVALPLDVETRARELRLPEQYILAVGTLEPRKGLEPLLRALALPPLAGVPLLVVGPAGWGDLDVASLASSAGLPPDRVRTLGFLEDADLAVAMSRASVFVYPSLAEGFGLPLLEAFNLGTPVVHSDAPALVEVASDAGVVVVREDAAGYPERLADAVGSVLADPVLAGRLRYLGHDRAKAFSWRTSAEQVWQLHADL